MPEPIAIVYADDSLVVVNKPAGLLAVPGRGADKQDCASQRVQQRYADALVVHRLDQATSGLMVMARGLIMQRAISRLFEIRQVHKEYIAVVQGWVVAPSGSIDLPLAADWPARPRQKVDPAAGKTALTHYTVLSRDALANTTRLALVPITGRTHQLRVHLSAVGHPICGDTLYGAGSAPHGASRLHLHAQHVALAHPASGEPMAWQVAPEF
jgi:tRNA pseudouridine32 synthase / 23S rRNA pseudouridine746 synthase